MNRNSQIKQNLEIIDDLISTSIMALKHLNVSGCEAIITTLNITKDYYMKILELLDKDK